MADPEVYVCELGGEERKLKLSAGAVRFAKLRHDVELSPRDLTDDPFGFAAKLVWIAILPHEPGVEEEQVAQWLALSDEEEEITSFMLSRFESALDVYMEQVDKLGKGQASMQEKAIEVMAEKLMDRVLASSTSGESTASSQGSTE